MMIRIILRTIKIYQNLLSPLFGRHCRFHPSCSEYAYQALEKYGICRGGWKGIKRILKCGPWSGGGVDLP